MLFNIFLGFIATNERNRKLKFRPPHELRVQDMVDSSFGENPDTSNSRRSYLGGYLVPGTRYNWRCIASELDLKRTKDCCCLLQGTRYLVPNSV